MTVSFADIERAATRIAPHAHVTPVLRARSLDALAGCELHFKCENFQRVGAFKFRGACNAVWSLPDDVAARGVVTHSSGNHGAALALAAQTRGIPAHVVVPQGAVATKVAAIARYGASVHECAPTLEARDMLAAQIQCDTGASMIHPYTDERVIAGQGTAARELIRELGTLDVLCAPIGGGGLIGGSAIAARALLPDIELVAAEPEGASEAHASLAHGARVTDRVPETIADGLRATLGEVNFGLLQAHRVAVVLADDSEIVAAMRLIWERLKIVIEPSSAVTLAAILRNRERFARKRVGIILSGGNVDLDHLPWCA